MKNIEIIKILIATAIRNEITERRIVIDLMEGGYTKENAVKLYKEVFDMIYPNY